MTTKMDNSFMAIPIEEMTGEPHICIARRQYESMREKQPRCSRKAKWGVKLEGQSDFYPYCTQHKNIEERMSSNKIILPPALAFVLDPTTNKVLLLERGVNGYRNTIYGKDKDQSFVDDLNWDMMVPPINALAMLQCSLGGNWDKFNDFLNELEQR